MSSKRFYCHPDKLSFLVLFYPLAPTWIAGKLGSLFRLILREIKIDYFLIESNFNSEANKTHAQAHIQAFSAFWRSIERMIKVPTLNRFSFRDSVTGRASEVGIVHSGIGR